MNILVFGGTGLVGRHLSSYLLSLGHDVYIVSRRPERHDVHKDKRLHYIVWRHGQSMIMNGELKKMDIVVNLSGEPLFAKRWSSKEKQELIDSRVKITRSIVESINSGVLTPHVLINASAIGYYGNRHDSRLTEESSSGDDFLAQVCRQWEDELNRLKRRGTSVVVLRFGVVLAKDGGMFPKLKRLFQCFMGGTFGPGYQYFSWIHIDDLVNMIYYVMQHPTLHYVYNAVSPYPLTYEDLAKSMGKVLHRPSLLRFPKPVLHLFLGERSNLLLHGQRVIPKHFIESSFHYKYPQIDIALEELVG